MSTEHIAHMNTLAAKKFFQALWRFDHETVHSMAHSTALYWQLGYELELSGQRLLSEAIAQMPKLYARLPNGAEVSVLSVVAEGRKVALEAESYAELSDGSAYRNQHHSVVLFNEDGKVVEYREYWDTLYAYEQLFGGRVGDNAIVADSDKRLHPATVFKLLPYVMPFSFLRQRRKSRRSNSLAKKERNKSRAMAFVEAIGNRDLVTLGSLYAPGGTFWQPGGKLILAGRHSQGETANLVPGIYRRLPQGMKFEILSVLAQGNKVAVEAVTSAPLQSGGLYKNQYNFLFCFNAKGKVEQFREYWGTLHAYRMLFEDKTDF